MKIDLEELDDFHARKQERMKTIDIWTQFEPIFKEIDQAVFYSNKRVLVHCQAGKSRSASLLAAYLINRFSVTTEQALIYLRSKRLNVECKFVQELKDYEESLKTIS